MAMQAAMMGQPFQPQPPTPIPELTIEQRLVPRIVETRFVAQTLLDERVIDSERFPYVPAFQFFDSGSNDLAFWGFVDVMKTPQKFMNNTLSMMDKIQGQATKNLTTVHIDSLREGPSEQGIVDELSKVNPVLFVENPNGHEQAVHVHPSGSFPNGYTELAQFMRSLFDATMPSTSYAAPTPGAQGGIADPSGRAIALQQKVADVSTAIVFHRFAYFRKLLGENLLFVLQHGLTAPMTFQLLGAQGGNEWVTLMPEGPDSIADDRFSVRVSDTDYSVSGKAVANQQIQQLFQNQAVIQILMATAPQKVEALVNALIDTSELPEDVKQHIQSIPMMPMQMPPPQGGAPSGPGTGNQIQPAGDELTGERTH
jgi:hypothetical protein